MKLSMAKGYLASLSCLSALLDGETAGLEISFPVLTGFVAAMLFTYVAKTMR